MSKGMNALEEALKAAAAGLERQVLLSAIATLPGHTSIGQLIDDFAGSGHNASFRAMSINGFIDAVRGTASASKGGATKVAGSRNTRTQAGRDSLDAEIATFLESQGTASSEEIRVGIGGGTSAQIRDSFERLSERGLVTKTGEKRATKYVWKGAKVKKGR